MKKLVIFDLDNTLSEARQKISPSISSVFTRLLIKKEVAIVSGGTFERLDLQVVSELPGSAMLNKLILLPQSGTSCFEYKNSKWQKIYDEEDLSPEEKSRILGAIEKVLNIEKPQAQFPPLIQDKGDQITYSPVGINASNDVKEPFDPDHSKRRKIVKKLGTLIPNFEIGIGGLSSVDITRKGRNKLYGVNKIMKLKNLSTEEVLFVGDALFEEGNDASIRSSGIECIQVSGPEETEKVIEKIIND